MVGLGDLEGVFQLEQFCDSACHLGPSWAAALAWHEELILVGCMLICTDLVRKGMYLPQGTTSWESEKVSWLREWKLHHNLSGLH